MKSTRSSSRRAADAAASKMDENGTDLRVVDMNFQSIGRVLSLYDAILLDSSDFEMSK